MILSNSSGCAQQRKNIENDWFFRGSLAFRLNAITEDADLKCRLLEEKLFGWDKFGIIPPSYTRIWELTWQLYGGVFLLHTTWKPSESAFFDRSRTIVVCRDWSITWSCRRLDLMEVEKGGFHPFRGFYLDTTTAKVLQSAHLKKTWHTEYREVK